MRTQKRSRLPLPRLTVAEWITVNDDKIPFPGNTIVRAIERVFRGLPPERQDALRRAMEILRFIDALPA